MRLGIRAGAETGLAVRLVWLTGLRLVVLTIFLVVTSTFYLGGFARGGFSNIVALVTVISAYALAGVYAALLRVGRALPTVAHAQLVTDQVIWTALVYITGGAASGATSLYGLTCLTGAILLGMRGGILAALYGVVAFVLLCVGLALRLVPTPPDQPLELYASATRWSEIAYPLFVNVLGVVVVAAMASYLAERLRATGGDLEVATARAEEAERLASLGKLAAGLAHEIRNPLGAIAGSIELLRMGGTLSKEDQQLCAIVEREASRLNDLVGDMLDLSRPRVPVKEAVDLGMTARDVVVLAGNSGRGSDVIVRYDGPASALTFADAAQMRQVVWNLVRNAIQASGARDVVLVRVIPGPTELLLEVSDRGAGIPVEARERMFDVFFTTRSHGMGIGLAVVKRILDDHGFAIEVESSGERGGGTLFRVRLPPEGDASGEPTSREPSSPMAQGGGTARPAHA